MSLSEDSFQAIRETLVRTLHLIGEGPAFNKVVEECFRVAPYEITVLIVGETGTGKELCARTLHFLSPQAPGPFVPVDCAALPETLFAHELFGHERGAFTDAREPRPGLLASAANGTLFLDEVESLSLNAQGALLRLLDTREWRPLGSQQSKPLACRILAATNEDLVALIQRGLFRRDLYYRLTGTICHLPPLRERQEDIPLLSRHFLSLFCRTFQKEPLTLSEDTLSLLCTYPWPGNIRELQNCLQHAILRAAGPMITPSDLVLSTKLYPSVGSLAPPWKEARKEGVAAWEKMYLTEILQYNRGNLAEIAELLHLSRMQLYRLLKKYHLHPSLRTG
jgi:DNA-binding NtrC family response regulator